MIPPDDLKTELWPPRQKGGQHVGVQTGIRVTHLPTGTQAIVNTDRSQLINRMIAVEMIEAAITHPRFR